MDISIQPTSMFPIEYPTIPNEINNSPTTESLAKQTHSDNLKNKKLIM